MAKLIDTVGLAAMWAKVKDYTGLAVQYPARNTRDSKITATTGGTTANRYFGLELDSDGKAFVNVPYPDIPSGNLTSSNIASNAVTSIGSKKGAITLKAGQSANGAINLSMNENELQAAIVGLGSAAYTASTDYATSSQGTKADNAVPKTRTVNGHELSANVTVTKSDVNLGNVTNDAQVKRSEMGVANGVATLDANGLVPSSQLPSYVDDVIEGYFYSNKFYQEAAHTNLIAGESNKIYVDLSTNKTYRCSNVTNNTFTVISETISLGETSTTAYRGDRGKTAYDHSQATEANPHGVTFALLAGDKPTTLAGYGITDAKIVGGTITLGGDTITPLTSHQSLSGYVPTSCTVNSKALSSNITLAAGDLKMTDYSKASTAGAVANTDTINAAIGKLEKALDGKEAAFTKNDAFNKNFGTTSGTVCQGNDSRLSDSRTPKAHASNLVTSLTGYTKGSDSSALATSDTLNAALGKLENQIAARGTVSSLKQGSDVTITPTNGVLELSIATAAEVEALLT